MAWTTDQLRAALKRADEAKDMRAATTIAKRLDAQLTAEGKQPFSWSGTGKAAATGGRKGAESLVGGTADLSELGRAGINAGAEKLGVAGPKTKAFGEAFAHQSLMTPIVMALRKLGVMEGDWTDIGSMPTGSTEDVGKATDWAVEKLAPTGVNEAVKDITRHKAGNPIEQFAQTGSEFATGSLTPGGGLRGLIRRGVGGFATGLASEGAGQLTEGTAYEPWARVGTGLAGGALSSSLLHKGPPTPAARRLMEEGVDLTAGQAIDSPGLKSWESQLGGGRTNALIQRQRDQFTANRMQQLGAPAGMTATPENLSTQYRRIGDRFNNVFQQVGDVDIDTQTQQRVMDAVNNYASMVGPGNQAPVVREQQQNLLGLFRANGNQPILTGQQYGELRASLGEQMRSADHATAEALGEIMHSLDDAVEAQLGYIAPELQGELSDARRQYRLYLDLERAVANEPAAIRGRGQVTGPSLAGGVKGVEGDRRLVQGTSEYSQPALDASVVMEGYPNSGTASRGTAMAAGGLAGAGEPVSALAAILGPMGVGRTLMSGPVQNALMSAPDNLRAALTAVIAANQARK